jgi:hypothetical protein
MPGLPDPKQRIVGNIGFLCGRNAVEGTMISGRESEEVEWPAGRLEKDRIVAEADI